MKELASGSRLLIVLGLGLFSALLLVFHIWNDGNPEEVAPQGKIPTVAMVTNNPNGVLNVQGFRRGLEDLGFVDGETVTILYSGGPTPAADLERSISQMIENGADLIFTAGTPTGLAAHEATRDTRIPVVFGVIADPIAAGVMSDLSHPGGNMTGVMLSANQARRLQLLLELAPSTRRILLPYNPNDAAPVSAVAQLEEIAPRLGVTLIHETARNEDEVRELIARIGPDADAIFMLPDSTVNRRVDELMARAVELGIPVSGPSTAQIKAGAIMSYGIVHEEVGIHAARIAARILRGVSPAETPVETADYYLTINLAAAERISLELPEGFLLQVDVIVREDDFGK